MGIKAVYIANDGSKREGEVESRETLHVKIPIYNGGNFWGQAIFELIAQHDDYMIFQCSDPKISFKGRE